MTPIDIYLLSVGLIASVTLGRLAGGVATRWHRCNRKRPVTHSRFVVGGRQEVVK